VTIAVIDSGVDGSHRSFPDGKIIAFKDYNGGRDDLDPTNGMNTYDSSQQPHGTMVSSVAAGTGGGTKYVGSAPGAYLIVLRVGGSSFDISNAVQWCINNQNKDFNKDGVPDGPDLITMSLGSSPNNYMDQVCTQAVTAGIPFFTSAGNSGPGTGTMTSPARAKDMIAVGAINDNKNVWYYSSRGPGAGGITKPDIMAPGVQVTVAYPGNNWIATSGTSFSSPMAAGAAALLLQLRPDITPAELIGILKDTAEDRGNSGPDNAYGWGVMNTLAALDKIPTIRELKISGNEVEEDEEITFKATTTGNILRYEWDFDGDGTFDYSSFDSPDTKHTYTESGFYEVTFKITDTDDETQTATDLIEVTNVNPELDVLYTSGSLNEDELLTLNVSATYDTPTDYSMLDYTWDFGDGTELVTRETEVEHSFDNQGTYDIKVTVEDDDGIKDTETIQIFVSNILPVADAGEAGRDASEDERLFFSGAGSYDTPSDSVMLNYTWDMGDGTVIHKGEFYYTYTESKTYSISLTVMDDNGGQDKSIVRATVKNVKPSVDIQELEEKKFVLVEDEEFTLHGIVNDTKSDLDSMSSSR
jgi:PKD repeat protein